MTNSRSISTSAETSLGRSNSVERPREARWLTWGRSGFAVGVVVVLVVLGVENMALRPQGQGVGGGRRGGQRGGTCGRCGGGRGRAGLFGRGGRGPAGRHSRGGERITGAL